jgi:hypothetical protein
MAQFRTHKGANNPPFFKGFPMSSIWYLLACFFATTLVSSILFGLFFSYIFTIILTFCSTTFVCYKAFHFLKEMGAFGMSKAFIRYFKAVDKILLKRPNIDKVHLVNTSKKQSWK